MTHTPEPWCICTTEPAEIRTHPCGGAIIGHTIPNAYNALRVVACVNACAGMADPATEIANLRNALHLADSTAAAALDELQSLRWVSVTERMPTLADASEFGDVEWSDGNSVWECRHDDPERATHWRKYTLP